MNANFAAFLYLVSGVLFILALRGLSHPTTSRQGNHLRHDRHGHRHRHHAGAGHARRSAASALIVLGLAIGGGVGAVIARAHRHDLDAAARRRLPLAGRPCRRHGRGGRHLCAGELRHRRGRRHPRPGAGRDVARRRHRRHHLHRLGHRLPEARRPHVRQADHAADAPCHQRRARRRAGRADRRCWSPPRATSSSG